MTPIMKAHWQLLPLAALAICVPGTSMAAQPDRGMSARHAHVMDFWTPQQRRLAIPRDLFLDQQGRAFTREANGQLRPHAPGLANNDQVTQAKPSGVGGGKGGSDGGGSSGGGGKGGGSDTTPPSVSDYSPAADAVIASSQTFSATVTDPSGIMSVTVRIIFPGGQNQDFVASQQVGTDTWSTNISGFTAGDWNWQLIAQDGAKKGGNTFTSDLLPFSVDTGNSGDTIVNSPWTAGGAVQTAGGRIYFQMPNNPTRDTWSGYVCSGTVAEDGVTGRSVILTAAHCAYDDANKAFARNVLFIPDQAGTSGVGTDLNCGNDPLGCWAPAFAVIDPAWAGDTFPNNAAADYAYYVVSDTGAHSGSASSSESLDLSTGSLPISFNSVYFNDGVPGATSVDYTHALGYSYSDDPNFMYCAEDMTTNGSANWWLASCGLSGGASGGAWVQPMDESTGYGDMISVNSWSYVSASGMAGPKLVNTSAECLFTLARFTDFLAVPSTDGDAGVIAAGCP